MDLHKIVIEKVQRHRVSVVLSLLGKRRWSAASCGESACGHSGYCARHRTCRHVSAEDAIAAIDNEDPAEADKPTWQAVAGYHAAMGYILQRCRDANFRFSKDVILAVHFM